MTVVVYVAENFIPMSARIHKWRVIFNQLYEKKETNKGPGTNKK